MNYEPSAPTAERIIIVDPDLLLCVLEETRRLQAVRRPGTARRILILMLANLCPTTGQVQLSRDDISKLLGTTVGEVSFALATLERLGCIRRELRGTPGRRGASVVSFINPALAWSGPPEARARWVGLPIARDRRMRRDDP